MALATLLGWIVLLSGPASGRARAAEPAARKESRTPFESAVEVVQAAAHAHPERSPAYYAELERGFRRLQREYPSEAQVYAELLFVADHTGGTNAAALARQVAEWPAPAPVKEKARAVLAKKEAVGRVYPWSATNTLGQAIRLEDFRGRVVLMDFWATWCGPCRERLPEVKALYGRFHARGLEIVGVSLDEDRAALQRFVDREKLPWMQVCDGGGWEGPTPRRHGLTSLPTMWLIDRRGRLREIDAWDDLAGRIQRLLDE